MLIILLLLSIPVISAAVLRGSTTNLMNSNVGIVSSNMTTSRRLEDSTDPAIQKFFKQRRELQEGVQGHNHAWHALREVDGLKNEDIAVIITSTSTHDEIYLWERIIPSARTWMKLFANAFVIVEDNFLVRYALRHCHMTDYEHYTTFACHNEPTYLLSRRCTNEYYGAAGPCCKVDDGFNFLVNDNKELFSHLKFVLHGDDDTFFRVEQVMRWLASMDRAGLDEFPIIANANPTRHDHGIWHIVKGCTEIQSSGWYQPLMLNHAALQRMAVGVANHAIEDTCRNFVVTHDVGLEPYAWIMQFNHVFMPHTEINGGHKGEEIFKPEHMIVHNIRHDDKDKCRNGNEKEWPENMRYNQHLVIGCGDINQPGPFHNKGHLADMYDAWNYYQAHNEPITIGVPGQNEYYKAKVITQPDATGKKIIKKIFYDKEDTSTANDEVIIPYVNPLKGYSETPHGKAHDLTKEWVEFKLSDCAIPGEISK